MTKKEFEEQINLLPVDARLQISIHLHQACSCINSVECILTPTPLHSASLLENGSAYSLWQLIFQLEKLFTPPLPGISSNPLVS